MDLTMVSNTGTPQLYVLQQKYYHQLMGEGGVDLGIQFYNNKREGRYYKPLFEV